MNILTNAIAVGTGSKGYFYLKLKNKIPQNACIIDSNGNIKHTVIQSDRYWFLIRGKTLEQFLIDNNLNLI